MAAKYAKQKKEQTTHSFNNLLNEVEAAALDRWKNQIFIHCLSWLNKIECLQLARTQVTKSEMQKSMLHNLKDHAYITSKFYSLSNFITLNHWLNNEKDHQYYIKVKH